PMILPLFGGISEIELFNMLLGRPKLEGPELIQETFRATSPPGDFATAWTKFVHDGFAADIIAHDRGALAIAGGAVAAAQQSWTSTSAPTPQSPEIVFVRDYSMDDGRYI